MELHLKFHGMTCLECAHKLERALQSVPGVENAQVSYGSKTGTVAASGEVDTATLLQVVERAGYRAEVVGGDGTSAPKRGEGAPTRNTATLPGPEQRTPEPDSQSGGRFDYDLLIIGTGGAGTAAAIRGSELGARVAIVEGAEVVGGTCVNIGCIPSKNLIEAAAHYHSFRFGFPGISECRPDLAWKEVIRQKERIIEELRQEKYLDVLASYEGVTLLRGRAKLLGNGRVRVGDEEVRARRIIVATGTSPAMPPIAGLEEARALDSTTVMELEDLPTSMIVIGAGAIGLELGQAFARFGVRVIALDVADRIVPNEDPEVSAALERALQKEGIEIHTGVQVDAVSRDTAGFTVKVRNGSLEGLLKAEQLLVATGRRPNTAELGLEAAGVEVTRRGFIKVDEYMRTSNPDVYAAGDVTGGPGYVYVAALGGGIAAQAALEERAEEGAIEIDLSVVPRVTFTDPQVAAVGMTEEEARAVGLDPKVTTMPEKYLPRAYVSYRQEGIFKIVAEQDTDRLLGVHVVAPNAGDLIGEAVLAIRFGLTTRDLVSTLHPYLTWGEGLKLAAQTFTKDVATLSCCA